MFRGKKYCMWYHFIDMDRSKHKFTTFHESSILAKEILPKAKCVYEGKVILIYATKPSTVILLSNVKHRKLPQEILTILELMAIK